MRIGCCLAGKLKRWRTRERERERDELPKKRLEQRLLVRCCCCGFEEDDRKL